MGRVRSPATGRLVALLLLGAAVAVFQLLDREPAEAPTSRRPTSAATAPPATPADAARAPRPSSSTPSQARAGGVAAAHARRSTGAWVEDRGRVAKLLADDRRGSRHQRFLLRVDGGPTILVAHNIDLAPRVEPLQVGDAVRFRGEYEWNARGGVLHWTHGDPDGRREGGWLEVDGRRYR